jgi:hypothetical protein
MINLHEKMGKWYNMIMKTQSKLNPMVFVRDENSSEFRAHIARRAKEAANPKNRLPISDLKKRLARHNAHSANA